MEQPDETFVAWAGPGETFGVGLRRGHSGTHLSYAAAMFALNRKSGHAECSARCSEFETRSHTMLVAPAGTGVVCAA
jgi:hypothetical protein